VAKHPWFPLYVADWLVGTWTLTAAERGIYIDLLAFQWDRGSVPGDDMVALGQAARCSGEAIAAAWPVLREKFTRGEDGQWRNERLEAERLAGRRLVERNQRGGQARAAVAARDGGKFSATQTSHQPNQPNHQPIHQPVTSKGHQPTPANSQSQSQKREERPRVLTMRRDLNAAFQCETFSAPKSWEERVLKASNGRLTRAVLLQSFYPFAQAAAEGSLPDLSGHNAIFGWLDAQLADWQRERDRLRIKAERDREHAEAEAKRVAVYGPRP
jgi:uncharacterized protein YdaU (DUF1376 family)